MYGRRPFLPHGEWKSCANSRTSNRSSVTHERPAEYKHTSNISKRVFTLPDNTSTCTLAGICTDRWSIGVNLLLNHTQNHSCIRSAVWHIPHTRLLLGGNVSAHSYPNQILTSLARRRSQNYGYLASGMVEHQSILSLYRLKSNTWGNCTGIESAFLETLLTPPYPNYLPEAIITHSYQNLNMQVKVCRRETLQVSTVCQ